MFFVHIFQMIKSPVATAFFARAVGWLKIAKHASILNNTLLNVFG